MNKEEILPRLVKSSIIEDVSNCWLWLGALNDGHGLTKIDGTMFRVHRLSAWIFHDFDLSDTENQVNHYCFNKNCWNPQHIYIGTQKENVQDGIMRGRNPGAHQRAKTHCKKGHEYTEENTYIYKGFRQCRECNKLRRRA